MNAVQASGGAALRPGLVVLSIFVSAGIAGGAGPVPVTGQGQWLK